MDAATEARRLRNNLIQLSAWIEHWQADVDCRLLPTRESLESAMSCVASSLQAIERLDRTAA